jgi:hypothetical protein
MLRGVPPLSVCTICIGKKEVGWENHFGMLALSKANLFYRGNDDRVNTTALLPGRTAAGAAYRRAGISPRWSIRAVRTSPDAST